jgi:hypothetical protein
MWPLVGIYTTDDLQCPVDPYSLGTIASAHHFGCRKPLRYSIHRLHIQASLIAKDANGNKHN